jgi:hypothetical protein
MSDHTVIPAAPGTVLMKAFMDPFEGSEVYSRDFMVIGWRVPNQGAGNVEAILIGGDSTVMDEDIGKVVSFDDQISITSIINTAGYGLIEGRVLTSNNFMDIVKTRMRLRRDSVIAEIKRRENPNAE